MFRKIMIFKKAEKDQKLIASDIEDIVVGLIALGYQPYEVDADGPKMQVLFLESDVSECVSTLQKALAIINDAPPLMVDYIKFVAARMWWKNMLGLVRGGITVNE